MQEGRGAATQRQFIPLAQQARRGREARLSGMLEAGHRQAGEDRRQPERDGLPRSLFDRDHGSLHGEWSFRGLTIGPVRWESNRVRPAIVAVPYLKNRRFPPRPRMGESPGPLPGKYLMAVADGLCDA